MVTTSTTNQTQDATSIDLDTEDLVRLTEAGKLISSNPSSYSLHRWRLKGKFGIKLECKLVGSYWHTSKEALHRFINLTTAAASKGRAGAVAATPTPAQRTRRQAATHSKLVELGVLKE